MFTKVHDNTNTVLAVDVGIKIYVGKYVCATECVHSGS